MAFLEELRQRKVVRVAIAYLVVAWLGVQVASIQYSPCGSFGTSPSPGMLMK